MADYLPETVITSILHRLSVKTLIRCTSVCKSWYSLITSQGFISSHIKFSYATKNTPLFIIIRSLISDSEQYGLYTDSESFCMLDEFKPPCKSMNSCYTIVGSYNGLICMSDDRVFLMHDIILWNPSVKKSILLPKPRLSYNSYGTFVHALGFGFDCLANDFKVVRITYADICLSMAQVQLYRFSVGAWEEKGLLGMECAIYTRSRQVFVNTAVHWVASGMKGDDVILLFDMCNEVFGLMKLPVGVRENGNVSSMDLVAHMESLAILCWNMSGVAHSICVWVMKVYGVEESWTNHMRIDCGGTMVRPLWVRENGELLATRKDGHLICYGWEGVKDLHQEGLICEDCWRYVHVDCFVESLFFC